MASKKIKSGIFEGLEWNYVLGMIVSTHIILIPVYIWFAEYFNTAIIWAIFEFYLLLGTCNALLIKAIFNGGK